MHPPPPFPQARTHAAPAHAATCTSTLRCAALATLRAASRRASRDASRRRRRLVRASPAARSSDRGLRRLAIGEPRITVLLEFERELGPARFHDAAVGQY